MHVHKTYDKSCMPWSPLTVKAIHIMWSVLARHGAAVAAGSPQGQDGGTIASSDRPH